MYKNFFPANELLSRHFNTIKYEVLSSTFEGVSCRTSKTFPPKVSDKRCEEGLSLDWKKTLSSSTSPYPTLWNAMQSLEAAATPTTSVFESARLVMFTVYLALSLSPTLNAAARGMSLRSSSAGEVKTWFIEEAICLAVSSACVRHKPFCSAEENIRTISARLIMKKTIAKRVSMESSIWLFIRYAFLTFFRADFDRAPFRARSELGSLRELYFEGTDVRA